jgi:hypothetical protein
MNLTLSLIAAVSGYQTVTGIYDQFRVICEMKIFVRILIPIRFIRICTKKNYKH